MFVCHGGPGNTPLFGGVANGSTLGQAGSGCWPSKPVTGFTLCIHFIRGTNPKGFRSLLLSVAYLSTMCPLSLYKKACNWVTQHPLAMGGVMCLMRIGAGTKIQRQAEKQVVCMVWCGVQNVYGTHTSWLLQVANHLDSVQTY